MATDPTQGTVATDGRLVVSLRWPVPDGSPCACHATAGDAADGGCSRTGSPPLFTDLVSPIWWLEANDCVHRPGCGCGLAGLAEAHAALSTSASRQACIDAAVGLLRALVAHREAAASDGSAATCAGCILDGANHYDHLDDAATTLSVDLGQVLSTDPTLTVVATVPIAPAR